MENPKNQHALVIWYLLNYDTISLKFVINDSMFIKMQTRLSEIESEQCKISNRYKCKFTNRFGRKSDYNIYSSCLEKSKMLELYEIYNK